MTKARDLADLLDASGNIIAQGTIDGRDIASDGSKLDSIEHGATGDQTHSEIRALIVAGVDTNVFTDADHSKLDGIEAGATADQTAAEIKTAYESNANTNEFSDAEQSKLAGIETGATADQTKADIDALNVDADTLDGQHGSYYTSYADTAVANIVDSAPGTLDTLNELAAALGDDPNFATTTATNIGTKANKTITVSAGSGLTGGGDLTSNRTISHADTSSQPSLTALTGAAVVSDIDVDTYGHVTGLATRNLTLANLGYTGETNATADQTITAGSGLSGGGTGNVTLSHSDTSSQASVNNSNGTVIQDITLDTYGHITGIASANLDGRYYTETEADSRFVNVTGDTITGTLTMSQDGQDVLNFSANDTNDARGISFNSRTALSADYNDGWLRLNQLSEFTNGVFTPGGLRVDGTLKVTSKIEHEGDTNTYMEFHAADQWRVVTGGAERLEVNNSQITSTEPIHAPSFHGDGSSLTGIASSMASLSDATVSTSDPAINTNPTSGVGHLWINSSSGEQYILTDATAGSNVWTNVGDGTGSVEPFAATGGTVTTSGSYTYHTFTSSGTFSVTGGSGSVDVLVAAGGGGGASGGGGAGGLIQSDAQSLTGNSNYTVVVGGGGARGLGNSSQGQDGGSSSISGTGISISTVGGGGGGTFSNSGGNNGRSGGSGSGAGGRDNGGSGGSGGSGTSGQGNSGGAGTALNTTQGRGGGGGKGSAGANSSGSTGGAGGAGFQWPSGGNYYAGGGGGGSGNGTNAAGGSGVGGNGAPGGGTGSAASANTASGGGGGGSISATYGGAGGSGIVIIRYLT